MDTKNDFLGQEFDGLTPETKSTTTPAKHTQHDDHNEPVTLNEISKKSIVTQPVSQNTQDLLPEETIRKLLDKAGVIVRRISRVISERRWWDWVIYAEDAPGYGWPVMTETDVTLCIEYINNKDEREAAAKAERDKNTNRRTIIVDEQPEKKDDSGTHFTVSEEVVPVPRLLTEDEIAAVQIKLADEGTEGQDRESYSDTQDRDSYTVTETPSEAEKVAAFYKEGNSVKVTAEKFGIPVDLVIGSLKVTNTPARGRGRPKKG